MTPSTSKLKLFDCHCFCNYSDMCICVFSECQEQLGLQALMKPILDPYSQMGPVWNPYGSHLIPMYILAEKTRRLSVIDIVTIIENDKDFWDATIYILSSNWTREYGSDVLRWIRVKELAGVTDGPTANLDLAALSLSSFQTVFLQLMTNAQCILTIFTGMNLIEYWAARTSSHRNS